MMTCNTSAYGVALMVFCSMQYVSRFQPSHSAKSTAHITDKYIE